jgi:hypothetical protein
MTSAIQAAAGANFTRAVQRSTGFWAHAVVWLKLGRIGDSQLRIMQPLFRSLAAERLGHLPKENG